MSYSNTLQVKSNSITNNDRLVCDGATSQEELYQHELMYFVYEKVLAASEQKPKESANKADIDSVSLIKAANRRALESVGRGVLK